MCVIKTLTNAWTTTHRLNESVRIKCIFGCEDPDVTRHYIVCDALARIVAEAGLVGLSSNVLRRLCIQNPDAIHACFVFVAFTTYHHVKHRFRDTVDLCRSNGNFRTIIDIATNVAASAKRKFNFLNPRLARSALAISTTENSPETWEEFFADLG